MNVYSAVPMPNTPLLAITGSGQTVTGIGHSIVLEANSARLAASNLTFTGGNYTAVGLLMASSRGPGTAARRFG